jgi:hypothetical protein
LLPVLIVGGGDEILVDVQAGRCIPVGDALGVGEAFVVGGEGRVCAEAGHGEDFGEREELVGGNFGEFAVGLAFVVVEFDLVADAGVETLGGPLVEDDLIVFELGVVDVADAGGDGVMDFRRRGGVADVVDEIDGDSSQRHIQFRGRARRGLIDSRRDIGGGGVEDGLAGCGRLCYGERIVIEAVDLFDDVIGICRSLGFGRDKERINLVRLLQSLLKIAEIGPEVERRALGALEREERGEAGVSDRAVEIEAHGRESVVTGAAGQCGIAGSGVAGGQRENECRGASRRLNDRSQGLVYDRSIGSDG